MRTFLSLLIFSAVLKLSAALLPGETIWEETFATKNAVNAWISSGSKPEWIPGGGPDGKLNAVRFCRKAFGDSFLIKNLDGSAVTGKFFLECWVRAENIKGERNISFLGPKVRFSYKTGNRMYYPEPKKGWGTYDWTLVRCYIDLPENATEKNLMVGLQKGSGSFEVAGLKIRKGKLATEKEVLQIIAARKPDDSIPRGACTGMKTRFRGVMSGHDLSPAAFADLKKWNVNLIRYQMVPKKAVRLTIKTDADYQRWIESEAERIEKIILPLAEKNGIKVVLDLHYGGYELTSAGSNTLSPNGTGALRRLIPAWSYLAKRFSGNKNIYGFDLLNEPVAPAGGVKNPWPEMAQILTDTIRKIDPATPIIIAWFQIAPFHIQGDNIIYSPHFYAPLAYTHQFVGSNRSKHLAYPSVMEDGTYYDKETLRESLKEVIMYQRKHKIKIYIGEFGVAVWAKGAAQWLNDAIELFEEYGWDWSFHAFREWSGWSVEHEGIAPNKFTRVTQDTDRKQTLLKYWQKNLNEVSSVPADNVKSDMKE